MRLLVRDAQACRVLIILMPVPSSNLEAGRLAILVPVHFELEIVLDLVSHTLPPPDDPRTMYREAFTTS